MRPRLSVALALTLVSAIHAQDSAAKEGVANLPLQVASSPAATRNLMDRIRRINNNIGRAIPVNTIPAELASGNLTSILRADGADEAEPAVDEAAQGIPDTAGPTDEQMLEDVDGAGEADAVPEKDGHDSEVEQATESLAVPVERRRRSPQSHNIGHAIHGAASPVRLGHALARNAKQSLQAERHVNGTARTTTIADRRRSLGREASSGKSRLSDSRVSEDNADVPLGIERKYGSGGK